MTNASRHGTGTAKVELSYGPSALELVVTNPLPTGAVEQRAGHGIVGMRGRAALVGGTLVPTERGLVRLSSLGDPDGAKWQELGIQVGTDEGPRTASQFYVNGAEPVVTVDPEVVAVFEERWGMTIYDGYAQAETNVIVATI